VINENNIIWCCIDSDNVDVQSTPLSESRHRSLWPFQITFNQTEVALMIFLQSGVLKNCWHRCPGIEPTTLDLGSQSDEMATLIVHR